MELINNLKMKKMKKIIALLIVATTLFSCDKTESPLFDGERRITYFELPSASLPVVLDEGGSVSRNIISSEKSDVDRTVEIEFVSSTLVDEEGEPLLNAFTFTETVTIPAGEFSGVFTVTGTSIDELTTSNELLVFKIANTSDGSDLNGSLQQLEIQMRLICPVADDIFVGEYAITEIDGPGDGLSPVLNNQNVTLSLVEGSSTARTFEAVFFESLGIGNGPNEIVFDIVCGTGIIEQAQVVGLACAGDPIFVGPGSTLTTIDTTDDSTFTIVIDRAFEVGDGCGVQPADHTIQFTKL